MRGSSRKIISSLTLKNKNAKHKTSSLFIINALIQKEIKAEEERSYK
jgi:hypothetical protein